MEDKLEDFLSSCAKIDFGSVDLSDREKEFYKGFNREIISLCDSLPESAQLDALLFFMKYSGLSIGQNDFFKNYYVPSWSIIYWLTQTISGCDLLTQEDIKNAITAHSMAMKLHSMDDHINDGELPASHLTLLLRSQAWLIMMLALKNLSGVVDGGKNIVRDFIDEYYSSTLNSNNVKTLDDYCDLFRKQMATWLIVPVLLAKKMTDNEEFTADVRKIYESFGIAWRLLDDIMDIEADMKKGAHSAVYICLAENKRKLWDGGSGPDPKNEKGHYETVLGHIMDKGLVYRIKRRIIRELESAASTSDQCRMKGLASEFRSLLKPLKEGQDSR